MKRCGDCGEEKPLDAFNRRHADSETRKSICRPCQAARRRRYHEVNGDEQRAAWRAWRERNLDAEKVRWAAYHAEHGPALAAAKREAYAADPEKGRAAQAAYRSAHPGSHRRWREDNPEKWRAANRANQARRRAGGEARANFTAVLEEHGWFCHLCALVIVDWDDLHFDHVVPLARGGTNDAANLRPAHARCNLVKGAS